MSIGKRKSKAKPKSDESNDVAGGDSTSEHELEDKKKQLDFGNMPPVAGGRGMTFTIKQNPDPSPGSKKGKSQP